MVGKPIDMEYVIEKVVQYDNRGGATKTHYEIKYEMRYWFFVWRVRWEYVSELDYSIAGEFWRQVKLSTLRDAEDYVKNILCDGKPCNEIVTTYIKTVTC